MTNSESRQQSNSVEGHTSHVSHLAMVMDDLNISNHALSFAEKRSVHEPSMARSPVTINRDQGELATSSRNNCATNDIAMTGTAYPESGVAIQAPNVPYPSHSLDTWRNAAASADAWNPIRWYPQSATPVDNDEEVDEIEQGDAPFEGNPRERSVESMLDEERFSGVGTYSTASASWVRVS